MTMNCEVANRQYEDDLLEWKRAAQAYQDRLAAEQKATNDLIGQLESAAAQASTYGEAHQAVTAIWNAQTPDVRGTALSAVWWLQGWLDGVEFGAKWHADDPTPLRAPDLSSEWLKENSVSYDDQSLAEIDAAYSAKTVKCLDKKTFKKKTFKGKWGKKQKCPKGWVKI